MKRWLWNQWARYVRLLFLLQVTHISRVGGNLEIRKESVRASVFRPTVELPSMTVEEYGEVELQRSRQVKVGIQGGAGHLRHSRQLSLFLGI